MHSLRKYKLYLFWSPNLITIIIWIFGIYEKILIVAFFITSIDKCFKYSRLILIWTNILGKFNLSQGEW